MITKSKIRLVPFQGGFDKRIPDKKAESIYQNRIEEVLVQEDINIILVRSNGFSRLTAKAVTTNQALTSALMR